MGDGLRVVKYRGKYAVQTGTGSNRRRYSLGTPDRAEAERKFAEYKRIVSLRRAKGPLTVGQIYEAYVQDRESEGKVSAPRMRDAWKRLEPTFGKMLPEEITKTICKKYTDQRLVTVKSGTIHAELGYLRTALRYAEGEGFIEKVPKIKLPSKAPPRDHRLTMDEVHRLIDAAEMPHVKLFIILAITTAARSGAILDLTWDRVDFKSRMIDLKNPNRPQTNKRRAHIKMNDAVYLALQQAYEAQSIGCNHVIEWAGQPVKSIKKGVRRAAERARLKCSPHTLRHSAAVWMAQSGIPLEEIAQFLGHTSTAITYSTYARFTPEYLSKASKALEIQRSLYPVNQDRERG